MTKTTPLQRIKPMEVLWGAWVREAIYHDEQDTWDFIGIYDYIRKHKRSDFPLTVNLQAVIAYQASVSESKRKFQLVLEILDLDKPIFSIIEDLKLVEFADPSIRWYETYKVENVIIREPGEYYLYILIDNQEKHRIPLRIEADKALIYNWEEDSTKEIWAEDLDFQREDKDA